MARASGARFVADDVGIEVPAAEAGTWQVAFDGRVVLSLDAVVVPPGRVARAAWVGTTTFYLDGVAEVSLRRGDRVEDLGEVGFGSGVGRVRFVEDNGSDVVIDKWGLAQRPFSTRDPEITRYLARCARELCDVARSEAGIELWMAFGTLLGAVRSGRAIAHDSDLDLAFLGSEEVPSRLTSEMTRLRRVLTEAGFNVVNKTGSFVTVLLDAPDGSHASIDVYTCFHFGGLLYKTASARAPVAREAVLPLQELDFEDQRLPAPRDPAALLEVSYGPSWREPDPGFVHRPSFAVRSRFDGWFGNVMRRRRDWEAYWKHQGHADRTSDFARWVCGQAPADALVVELGIGAGDDAVAYARSGRPVVGLDYARSAGAAVAAHRDEFTHDHLSWSHGNLYDLRDAVSWSARVARRPERRRVVVARGLLESMRPEERDGAWTSLRMLGRDADGCFLEVDECSSAGPAADGVWRFALDRADVRRAAARAGATVTHETVVGAPVAGQPRGRRWRMVLDWPDRASGHRRWA